MKSKMIDTTTQCQLQSLVKPIEYVWDQIAHDIPEDEVSAYEMIEISIDANRLLAFGEEGAEKVKDELVAALGYEMFMEHMVSLMPYSAYEAGGAQDW